MPPDNNLTPVGLTKAEFNRRYWFNNYQMVTVVNPLPDDFYFFVEMRRFMVPKDGQESFPGPIANLFLDQMSKMLTQNEEKMELLSDMAFKASYYNKLIVEVKNLVPEAKAETWQDRAREQGMELPPWMQNQPVALQPTNPQSATIPPWEQPIATAPVAPPATPPTPPIEPSKPVKEETREFEMNGIKFKSTVDKNGNTMYFKNGNRTSEADYAKAASMI